MLWNNNGTAKLQCMWLRTSTNHPPHRSKKTWRMAATKNIETAASRQLTCTRIFDMTPGEAIRKFCIECVGSMLDVHTCGGGHCFNGGSNTSGLCLFFPYRLGKGRPTVKLIRKICLWCMDRDTNMIKECPGNNKKAGIHCHLWPFRLARNPNFVLSPSERKRRIEHGRTLQKRGANM